MFFATPRRCTNKSQQVLHPTPLNPTLATRHQRKQKLRCSLRKVALQHFLFCSADIIFTKSCAATNEKLQCNIEKLRCKKVALSRRSCGFQAPTCRHPRLGQSLKQPTSSKPTRICTAPFEYGQSQELSGVRNPQCFLKSTAVQMGGVLPYKWEAYLQYKWEVYCWASPSSKLRSQEGPAIQMGRTAVQIGDVLPDFVDKKVVGVRVSETLPTEGGHPQRGVQIWVFLFQDGRCLICDALRFSMQNRQSSIWGQTALSLGVPL